MSDDTDYDRPYSSRYEDELDRRDNHEESRDFARMKLFGPAAGFAILAFFSFAFAAYYLTAGLTQMREQYAAQRRGFEKKKMNEQQRQMALQMHDTMTEAVLTFMPIYAVVIAAFGVLFAIASALLFGQRGRGFAFFVAIVAVIPISAIFIYGLPVGIFALVVLSDQRVKTALQPEQSAD